LIVLLRLTLEMNYLIL